MSAQIIQFFTNIIIINFTVMNYESKVNEAFTSLGYDPQRYLNKYLLQKILTQLNGSEYIQQITDEIWDQVEINPNKQALVKDISRVIVKAQSILLDKIHELQQKINTLVQYKNKLHATSSRQATKIQNIENDILQSHNDKKEYEQDLTFLTRPFGIYIDPRDVNTHPNIGNSFQVLDDGTEVHSQELKYMLWLSAILFFNDLICIYSKFGFLNIIVSLALLSIFLFNQFHSSYLYGCIWLSIGSIGVDFIWLMVSGGSFWSIISSTIAKESNSYLQLVIVLTIINVVLKIVISIILFKYKDVQEGRTFKVCPIPSVKITLSATSREVVKFPNLSNLENSSVI